MSLKRYIFFIWFCLLPSLLFAQTEAEIRVNAEQLFEKEQYVAATPLYVRLLSLQPRDFNYNYKYGTCLLYNSNKKQDAVRYLSYAVSSQTIDPAAHFFLGRAYHLNYQFNDAMTEYKKYQSLVGLKGKYSAEALRNSEMCQNGKKLLSTITEIIVTKKSEIESADFFRLYDLTNIGGSFVVAVDFQTKSDKKMNHVPLVHFPVGTDKIFYSSYGDGNQKDIYMVRRLPDGKFSMPQRVSGGVNSSFDEDYPYMHPNGNYLYFSSKGHNSMGGYDVFRSAFNAENNTFGPAENIDFAISSPDDDILYVVDKDDKNAYFASSRQSQDGKLFVYKVMVERIPIQLAVVKGYFESGINPANKVMSVEVIDKRADKSIGTFKTDPKGSYLVIFPKGGKYEYRVKVEGSDEKFICQVDIPYLKDFKPLKQKMFHEVAENKETVRILNLFDEDVDDAQAIIAQVLKDRSDLNVNVDNFDINELGNSQESKKILAEIGASELSISEVGQLLQRRSLELASANNGLSKEENAVNALVLQNINRIKEINKEVKELVREADQSESDVVQHSILMEAKELIGERAALSKSITETEKTGTKIAGGDVNKVDQEKFDVIQKEFNDLVISGKENDALQVIKKNDAFIKTILQGEGNKYEAELISEQKKIDAQLEQQKNTSLAFEKDIKLLEAEIKNLEEQKLTVKEKFKAEIQDKIDYKNQQIEEFTAQRNTAQTKQIELAAKRNGVEDELELIRSIQNYSGAAVSSEQVAQAKKELGTGNAKTLAQYIDSQIAELVKNNPSLENSKGNLSESAKIIAIHNTKSETILGTEGLSESQRTAQSKKLNTETLNELQERYIVAKAALKEDRFNDALAKEIAVNEKFSNKLKTENSVGKEITNTNYSCDNVEQDLFPDYQSNNSKITENSSYSDKEKWNALNKSDTDFSSAIDKELIAVNSQLTTDSQNKSLINKKDVLEAKQAELKQSVEQRTTQITAADAKEIADNSTKVTEPDTSKVEIAVVEKTDEELKQNLAASLPKDITNEVEKINSSKKSDSQKQQAVIAKHSEYLNELEKLKIKKSAGSTEDDIETQRTIGMIDELIQTEQATIEELKAEATKVEITETIETTEIAKTVDSPTKESVMAEIDPSFKSDIAKIEKVKGKAKYDQLIQREQDLQNNLETKIAEVQTELSTDAANESLKSELNILTNEYQESIARVGNYAEERNKVESNATVNAKEMIAELRTELLTAENKGMLDQNYSTLDDLKKQDEILANYEIAIAEKIDELNQLNETNESKKRTQEIDILEKELAVVQKKRRSVSVSVGDIEQKTIAKTPENNSQNSDDLKNREAELQDKLAQSDLSPKEKKQLTKELAAVSNQKAGLEIPVTQKQIAENKTELASLLENETTPSSQDIKDQLAAKENAIDALLTRASKEKSDLAKNYLLNEALDLQKEAKDDFLESKVEARNREIQQANDISVNENKAELESKVRRFSVEVGDITQEIDAAKKAQSKAKSSQKPTFDATIESLEADLKVATLKLKDAELALSRVVAKEEIVLKESLRTELTFDEEFQIASSKEYENYAKAVKSALDTELEISALESKINQLDRDIKKLIERELFEGEDHSDEINEKAQQIKSYSVEVGELQRQLDERKQVIAENTPSDSSEKLKFENLVMRGVNPFKKAALALDLVRLPSSGIEINSGGVATNYTAANPIPVNVESPSGLVYRVQVGAFAKPIPQDLFKEFTPVSGEKIANTNIIRYMAGFFNNSDKVVSARDQIKGLGYADAFIVAYCDGKRISFSEARNLERSGACVPKGTNEIMLEVAEKTAITMGYENVTKEAKPVSEYAYNQAPGAAKAEAIEMVQGLFYTVQVGVYNRPVNKEQLFNLNPLMTLRLPNGQIRYSCGKFLDVNEAKSSQREIRTKGIVDAFVTAYFNGKRISWQEGLEIQNRDGAGVMANLNSKQDEALEDKQVQNAKVIEVFTTATETVSQPTEKGIQLISKELYTEYPREVLNRYNSKGSFYYDESDQKVKSMIYASEDQLPRIQGFKSEIDTVYLTKKELHTFKGNTLIIQTPEKALAGDFADWLLKMNYRRTILPLNNGLEIRIFDVREESLEKVKIELALFGLSLKVQREEGNTEKE